MNFKEKRQAKKLARIFTTLAYGMMIMFAGTAIGGMILLIVSDELIEVSGLQVFVYVGIPFILIFVLGFIGQRFINKRVAYKQGIAMYRQKTFFTKVIKLIMAGDKDAHKKAVRLYDCVDEDSALRKFLFSYIVTSSYYNDDKKVAKKGKTRLMEILEDYDPKKVDLHKKISLL